MPSSQSRFADYIDAELRNAGYIQRIFDDVFGAEVTLIVAELAASDADPAMEPLRPQAQRSRADAHALAESTAIRHAARMRPTIAAS